MERHPKIDVRKVGRSRRVVIPKKESSPHPVIVKGTVSNFTGYYTTHTLDINIKI